MVSNPDPAQRSILADFVHHRPNLGGWLRDVVAGRPPPSVAVPPGEDPLDHLLAVFGQHADREQTRALADAAGELLLRWMTAHAEDPNPGADTLRRLSRTLLILESAPAPPLAARRLFDFCQLPVPPAAAEDGRSLRRQALFALALSPPANHDVRQLLDWLNQELNDPQYAVAAFTGLQRLSLHQAVEEVPRLWRTLRRADLPPDEALWELLRELEQQPAEAAHLRLVVDTQADLGEELIRLLRDDLDAAEEFPQAWAAFKARPAHDSAMVTPSFQSRMTSDSASQELQHALQKLAKSGAGLSGLASLLAPAA